MHSNDHDTDITGTVYFISCISGSYKMRFDKCIEGRGEYLKH